MIAAPVSHCYVLWHAQWQDTADAEEAAYLKAGELSVFLAALAAP